jgi:hypothetical protein
MKTEFKTCSDCGKPKPLSDYYIQSSNGKPEKRCKKCKNILSKTYRKSEITSNQNKSGVPHEQKLIKKLKAQGIYACSGKRSRTRWVDVVAFGCVAIEAKKGMPFNTQSYLFRFTPKQVKRGIRGDIVAFIIDREGTREYYLMRKDCPFLYDEHDYSLKPAISFTPDPKSKNVNLPFVRFMATAKDDWQLVWDVLCEKINKLKAGEDVDKFTS